MITLEEFFSSKKELAIHCKTEEEANNLLKAFDKLGRKWSAGDSYLKDNHWRHYKADTCYSNKGMYCYKKNYIEDNCKVYEFEDVILEDK